MKQSLPNQFLLVMWKNLLLRRRHWLLTAFEIIIPVLLFSILLSVRILPDSAFVPKYINTTTDFNVVDEKGLREIVCEKFGTWILDFCVPIPTSFMGDRRIFYGPPGTFTENVAKHVARETGMDNVFMPDPNVLLAVNTTEEMDEAVQASYLLSNKSVTAYYVGLFFRNTDGDEVPEDLIYDLRMPKIWFTDVLYPYLQIPGPRNFSLFGKFAGSYNLDGFTYIQSLVDRYFISTITGNESFMNDYKVEVQMYPYPPYVQDNGISQFYGSSLPTFVVLSLVLLSPSLIKSIVYEKETGVRELMKLMGLNQWIGWIGWFFHSFITIIIVSAFITVMLKASLTSKEAGGFLPPILAYSDGFLVWVILLAYGISSIAFCIAISAFFSRPTLATTMGILLWMISFFLPRAMMEYDYDTMGLTPKLLSCLLPNMAVTWAFRIIAMFEGRSIGLQWGRLWETGNPRDQLTPGMVLIMLLADSVIFFLVAWYVDQVRPGVYGVPQDWYFVFKKSYWCGSKPSREDDQSSAEQPQREYFEEEPASLKPGIVIKNLRKEFKSFGKKKKVALENVSFKCYEGQCTVLLGHNGAGKTTTMSILTGVYAPTSGQAEVGGWDIATHLKEARQELGLCPQHNMLFVDLTVYQHLLFFGRLKGMSKKTAKQEAVTLMTRLELSDKKNMYGNQLSGGMKRKLCLAISLIGGSKVVILDEPSSGLDPESRRWVWDVVQKERGSRTFLVTTHHMEEADVLGDRVAIMSAGKVVASGSTLFLKNKFGDGYTLTLLTSETSNAAEIGSVIQSFVSEAVLRSAARGEIVFQLPPKTEVFPALLESLTSRKEELGILHVGLSLTTMEQVFLRASTVLDNEVKDFRSSRKSLANGNGHFTTGLNSTEEDMGSQRFLYNSQSEIDVNLTGLSLLIQRLFAFIAKRFIYCKRKWILLLIQGLLPVLVTILCLAVDASFEESTGREGPVVLNMSIYPESSYYVQADDEPHCQLLSDSYEELFWGPYKVFNTSDIEKSLLDEGEKNIFHYRENNIASAVFSRGSPETTKMRAMYQSVPFHTPAVSMSLVTNALLRYATSSNGSSITTYNRPLPPNRAFSSMSENTSASAMVYCMLMPLALAFLAASFLVFPLQERESKAKQVQIMTGAPLWTLWFTSFIWDFFVYSLSAVLIFITIMIGDTKSIFTVDAAPGALLLLLLMFGWGSIPMAYVFSFPFQTAASGFAVVAVINIVAGQIIYVAVTALDMANSDTASKGFENLVDTSYGNEYCDVLSKDAKEEVCQILVRFSPYDEFVQCCDNCSDVGNRTCFEKRSYLEYDDEGMGPDILNLFVNGVIFFALLILIEINNGRFFKWLVWNIKRSLLSSANRDCTGFVDEDVVAEGNLVDSITEKRSQDSSLENDVAMLVSGLTKTFYGAVRPAVNNVRFRVVRGECLGLLGVNGAGKTTTFRMLTGDERPTSGDAFGEKNVSLMRRTRKFTRQIGYCPQFDAIINELTAEEMLTLMGRLRGVHNKRLSHSIASLISLVDLTECAKRPSSTYSGGNKRKLSTAMALVGSPPLIFLDEPTSGVDPASRRRVWEAITQAVNNGQSVLLTSHSMEECEALCSRVIIMSRGQLRCIGSTGYLKAKFGQGYSLQIKLKMNHLDQNDVGIAVSDDTYNSKIAELKRLITQRLPGARLTDQHKGMIAYRIPVTVSWSQLFSVMESLKTGTETPASASQLFSLPIVEDYAVSEASLEQVFLSFAREESSEIPAHVPVEVVTKF
ncbi:LOW QUALITY PROTEIN: phospholipid-transporting ATPase ABCA3-like [Palaemon carinicauda]|uniref:LOW QUALITY PROTEIN: phospholipid-transporting ATPase ABCA3-like n=1 Tax=Palaemon carinicauda TaxID=392227 RepID=UPI0035B64DA2